MDLIDESEQEFCDEIICELICLKFYFSKMIKLWRFWTNILIFLKHMTTLTGRYVLPQDFWRANIEDYCFAFLEALNKNPNFHIPEYGDAAEAIINDIFLVGLQIIHFCERI